MVGKTWLALATLAAVSCGDSGFKPLQPTSITITVQPKTLRADGVATAKVQVGGNGLDVSLTVDRGTFQDTAATTTVVKGGSGSVMLVTCLAGATQPDNCV